MRTRSASRTGRGAAVRHVRRSIQTRAKPREAIRTELDFDFPVKLEIETAKSDARTRFFGSTRKKKIESRAGDRFPTRYFACRLKSLGSARDWPRANAKWTSTRNRTNRRMPFHPRGSTTHVSFTLPTGSLTVHISRVLGFDATSQRGRTASPS
eukprot:30819-Pelagococcus_subviridis.AAC.1